MGGPDAENREHPGLLGTARAVVWSLDRIGSKCGVSQGEETRATVEKSGKGRRLAKVHRRRNGGAKRMGCGGAGRLCVHSYLLQSRRLTQSRVVVAQLPIRVLPAGPPLGSAARAKHSFTVKASGVF
jgi:hypothetical protein